MKNLDSKTTEEKEIEETKSLDEIDSNTSEEEPEATAEDDLQSENGMLKDTVSKLEKELKAQKNKVKVMEYLKDREYPSIVMGLFDCSSDERVNQVMKIIDKIFIPKDGDITSSIGFSYFVDKVNSSEISDVRIITAYDEVVILDKIINYLAQNKSILREIFGDSYQDGKIVDSLKEAFFNPNHTSKGELEKRTIDTLSYLRFK